VLAYEADIKIATHNAKVRRQSSRDGKSTSMRHPWQAAGYRLYQTISEQAAENRISQNLLGKASHRLRIDNNFPSEEIKVDRNAYVFSDHRVALEPMVVLCTHLTPWPKTAKFRPR
jgi:hypothetical protein